MKNPIASLALNRALLALPLAAVLTFAACASTVSDSSLQSAVASPVRGDKAPLRDRYRHPVETLQFFALAPNQSVLEIAPGGGWYTDILAPYLRDHGTLYEAQYLPPQGDLPAGEAKSNAAFASKIAASPGTYGTVVIGSLRAGQLNGLPAALQVDRVLTFRNIHNWIEDGQVDASMHAFYQVLKPGGMLGVEEHRAKPGTSLQQMIDTGYVTEAYVIEHAKAAGFTLSAKSEVNSNPDDTKDYPNGVWSLPPTYRGGATDHDRFAAIGESDRMTLLFVKP
jgi:predicted methyltransferase